MEYVLPSELLIKIFTTLSSDDLEAVSQTCTYWKLIVEDFWLWQRLWELMLKRLEQSSLKHDTCRMLKQYNVKKLNIKKCYKRLLNVVWDNELNHLYDCFVNTQDVENYHFAVLKTHFSHIHMKVCKNLEYYKYMNFCFFVVKQKNPFLAKSSSYESFRNPSEITRALSKIFPNAHRFHIKALIYSYPLAMGANMTCMLKYLFESCHISEIILLPRVLTACFNLTIKYALVVFSTSRSTEVAVIANGEIEEGRWREVMVGGWRLAQHLYETNKWAQPNTVATVDEFESECVKDKCWIQLNPNTTRITKSKNSAKSDSSTSELSGGEEYLAAEIMYSEMQLCQNIKELLDDLPDQVVSKCLQNVALIGGNCQLKNLRHRLKNDLVKLFPKYESVITTSVHDARILAYTPCIYIWDTPITKTFQIGKISRLKREHYITGDI